MLKRCYELDRNLIRFNEEIDWILHRIHEIFNFQQLEKHIKKQIYNYRITRRKSSLKVGSSWVWTRTFDRVSGPPLYLSGSHRANRDCRRVLSLSSSRNIFTTTWTSLSGQARLYSVSILLKNHPQRNMKREFNMIFLHCPNMQPKTSKLQQVCWQPKHFMPHQMSRKIFHTPSKYPPPRGCISGYFSYDRSLTQNTNIWIFAPPPQLSFSTIAPPSWIRNALWSIQGNLTYSKWYRQKSVANFQHQVLAYSIVVVAKNLWHYTLV